MRYSILIGEGEGVENTLTTSSVLSPTMNKDVHMIELVTRTKPTKHKNVWQNSVLLRKCKFKRMLF